MRSSIWNVKWSVVMESREAVCTEGLGKWCCKWNLNCRKEPAVWDLRAKLSGERGQCSGPRQEWAWPARDTEWIIDACLLHGDLRGHPGSSHCSHSGHGQYVYLRAADSYMLHKWLFLSSASACQNPGDGWLMESPRNRLCSGLLIIPFPLKLDLPFSAWSLRPQGLTSLGMRSALFWRDWQSMQPAHSCFRITLQSPPQVRVTTLDVSCWAKTNTERQEAGGLLALAPSLP